jgi:hypothetical protein
MPCGATAICVPLRGTKRWRFSASICLPLYEIHVCEARTVRQHNQAQPSTALPEVKGRGCRTNGTRQSVLSQCIFFTRPASLYCEECVCVCVYIYIYTHIHIHIHTHT